MLSQKYRFHGYGSLRYVLKHGSSYRAGLYTVRYSRNPYRKRPRFAVVVSKKVAKKATMRNTIRRKIYEVFRTSLLRIPPQDMVVIIHSADVLDWKKSDLEAFRDTLRQHCALEESSKN